MMLHSAIALNVLFTVKQKLMVANDVNTQLTAEKKGKAWECQDQSYGNHDPPARHRSFG
jgi:hypothetical protein